MKLDRGKEERQGNRTEDETDGGSSARTTVNLWTFLRLCVCVRVCLGEGGAVEWMWRKCYSPFGSERRGMGKGEGEGEQRRCSN